MTNVEKEDAEAFLREITEMLNVSGKTVVYFKCSQLFSDSVRARMAATVLVKFLKSSGNRVGDYFVFKDCRRTSRNGIRWKAVKVSMWENFANGCGTFEINTSCIPNL